jgi:hypothetical protein
MAVADMSPRERLAVMVRTDRGDMTVWPEVMVTAALDAYRAEVLRGVAAEWAAHCPEHAVADATWMECPCTWVADLRRRADAVEGGGSR